MAHQGCAHFLDGTGRLRNFPRAVASKWLSKGSGLVHVGRQEGVQLSALLRPLSLAPAMKPRSHGSAMQMMLTWLIVSPPCPPCPPCPPWRWSAEPRPHGQGNCPRHLLSSSIRGEGNATIMEVGPEAALFLLLMFLPHPFSTHISVLRKDKWIQEEIKLKDQHAGQCLTQKGSTDGTVSGWPRHFWDGLPKLKCTACDLR